MSWFQHLWQDLVAEPAIWVRDCLFQPTKCKHILDEEKLPGHFMPRLVAFLSLCFILPLVFLFLLADVLHLLFGLGPGPDTDLQVLVSFGQYLGDTIGSLSLFSHELTTHELATYYASFYNALSIIHPPSPVSVLSNIFLGVLFIGLFAFQGYFVGTQGVRFKDHTRGIVGGTTGAAVGVPTFLIILLTAWTPNGVVPLIAFLMAIGITSNIGLQTRREVINGLIAFSLSAIVFGSIVGFVIGNATGLGSGLLAGMTTWVFVIGLVAGGLYRVPLYLFSGFSAFKAYHASRKNPVQVLPFLRHSALYWDERVYLPLPYLKQTLLLAAHQDAPETLSVLNFIVAERRLQLQAARAVYPDVVLFLLQRAGDMQSIASVSHVLAPILADTRRIGPVWQQHFTVLCAASKCASTCENRMSSLQTHRNAVESMLTNLRSTDPGTVARDTHRNLLLEEVVTLWIRVAEGKQEALRERSVEITQQPFNNPYVPGLALKLGDPLFVGRVDLLRQLEEELSIEGKAPALLLNGERRMGKTSVLCQFPNKLSTRFSSIFCDLQKPGVSSDVARFFEMLASEIRTVVGPRQIPMSTLSYKQLKVARESNEATVYQQFNIWLKPLEELFEREQRVLLLVFDEFEELGGEDNAKCFNKHLLQRWLRNMNQNHPHVALLFSGTKTLEDMDRTTSSKWAASFVNVRTLPMRFLSPQNARELITISVLDDHSGNVFRGEEIFGDVVELIVTQTGCHPFLLQAICFELFGMIRAQKRVSAGEQDVRLAVEQVLEGWWEDYFCDLWERTNEEQRACLGVLTKVAQADPHHIQEHCGLDTQATGRAIQTLLRRNLVQQNENGEYQIATPIFQIWAERCITRDS